MRNATIVDLSVLFWGLAIFSSTAWAGPREDTLAGISRCAALPDDRTFLDCLYGAAQPMRARLGLQPAPVAQQRLVPPLAPAPIQAPPPNAGTAPNASPLYMTAYSFDKRGLFTVTLSDGSVWHQDASDTNFAHFGGKASSYRVTLVAGEYGKSRMNVRGEPGPYLVEQVR
ncbi:MAG TPA: hypothetical protein VN175_09035 [Rhizomicrobium sp.]|jgi:hypothetical protein|nr:hypothetical protein [Rhizomicrobium sp.]